MDAEDSLLLSLRAWPEESPSDTSASTLIRRIQLERSHFREINESLLESEIAEEEAAAAAAAAAAEDPTTFEEDEPPAEPADEDPVARIVNAKREMDALLE